MASFIDIFSNKYNEALTLAGKKYLESEINGLKTHLATSLSTSEVVISNILENYFKNNIEVKITEPKTCEYVISQRGNKGASKVCSSKGIHEVSGCWYCSTHFKTVSNKLQKSKSKETSEELNVNSEVKNDNSVDTNIKSNSTKSDSENTEKENSESKSNDPSIPKKRLLGNNEKKSKQSSDKNLNQEDSSNSKKEKELNSNSKISTHQKEDGKVVSKKGKVESEASTSKQLKEISKENVTEGNKSETNNSNSLPGVLQNDGKKSELMKSKSQALSKKDIDVAPVKGDIKKMLQIHRVKGFEPAVFADKKTRIVFKKKNDKDIAYGVLSKDEKTILPLGKEQLAFLEANSADWEGQSKKIQPKSSSMGIQKSKEGEKSESSQTKIGVDKNNKNLVIENRNDKKITQKSGEINKTTNKTDIIKDKPPTVEEESEGSESENESVEDDGSSSVTQPDVSENPDDGDDANDLKEDDEGEIEEESAEEDDKSESDNEE